MTEQQFLVLLPKDGEDEKTFNIFFSLRFEKIFN